MTWRQQGTSSNLTFYVDSANSPANLWCEVLTNDLEKNAEGKWRSARVPDYLIAVFRNKAGQLGEFRYKPKTNAGLRLSPRTLARLVKEHGYA